MGFSVLSLFFWDSPFFTLLQLFIERFDDHCERLGPSGISLRLEGIVRATVNDLCFYRCGYGFLG